MVLLPKLAIEDSVWATKNPGQHGQYGGISWESRAGKVGDWVVERHQPALSLHLSPLFLSVQVHRYGFIDVVHGEAVVTSSRLRRSKPHVSWP